MRNYQETEANVVIVIARIPVVDVGKTAVVRVTTVQTVTVSKLCAWSPLKLTAVSLRQAQCHRCILFGHRNFK